MATERSPKPKKRRRKRTPKAAAAELAIEKRRVKATKLRLAGWSMRDIAAHLKCSLGTVHTDLEAVLARTQETANQYLTREKALSLARLDVATKGIWAGVESGDKEAVDGLVKLENRRAKLLGTDAPAKQELSGPAGAPIPIDARGTLLDKLARLIAREAPPGGEAANPPEPEPAGG
jgi:hypothetical protein